MAERPTAVPRAAVRIALIHALPALPAAAVRIIIGMLPLSMVDIVGSEDDDHKNRLLWSGPLEESIQVGEEVFPLDLKHHFCNGFVQDEQFRARIFIKHEYPKQPMVLFDCVETASASVAKREMMWAMGERLISVWVR